MPIVTSDLKLRRSTTAGSAGNTTTQPNPQACLGKYISTTDAPSGLHGLFTGMSADDNAGMVAQYVCLFLCNMHATLTWTGAKVWLDGGDPAGGAAVALAVDPTAASAAGSSSPQALTATSLTAPGAGVTGLSWSSPSSEGSGISLGDIGPGQCRAFWVRRTGANSPATTESITLRWVGGTLA